MSEENNNPSCIKCEAELMPPDGDNWEKFKKHDETGLTTEEIWLCPNCIMNFQAYKELYKSLEKSSESFNRLATPLMNIYSELNKINDEAGE